MQDTTDQSTNIKSIYGPVHSWRSGTSLGVDIIGNVSTCSFNCVYCQLGKIQKITTEIKTYVPTEKIIQDLIEMEAAGEFNYNDLDVITFAGSGEPTLAENLAEAITAIRKLYQAREKQVPISILTNATMLNDSQVRERVKLADLVSLKLDAVNDEILKAINQPAPGVTMRTIIDGIKILRNEIDDVDKLQLQIMIMPKYLGAGGLLRFARNDGGDDSAPQDDGYLNDLAALIAETQVSKIQINTPTRPKPVSKTGEYWIETRGNHYGPNEAQEVKPEFIEFKELPVISQEEAFKVEDTLREALAGKVSGLEIVNVYKR